MALMALLLSTPACMSVITPSGTTPDALVSTVASPAGAFHTPRFWSVAA